MAMGLKGTAPGLPEKLPEEFMGRYPPGAAQSFSSTYPHTLVDSVR